MFSCHFVVINMNLGHDVTKIGLPETSLGIIPGAGGTQRATKILGPSKAKDLIFTARTLTATEALEFGKLNLCHLPTEDTVLSHFFFFEKNSKQALLIMFPHLEPPHMTAPWN